METVSGPLFPGRQNEFNPSQPPAFLFHHLGRPAKADHMAKAHAEPFGLLGKFPGRALGLAQKKFLGLGRITACRLDNA